MAKKKPKTDSLLPPGPDSIPTAGQFLQTLRKALRLTQQQLAERLNVSTSFISLLESDVRTMSHDILLLLSDQIGLPQWVLPFLNHSAAKAVRDWEWSSLPERGLPKNVVDMIEVFDLLDDEISLKILEVYRRLKGEQEERTIQSRVTPPIRRERRKEALGRLKQRLEEVKTQQRKQQDREADTSGEAEEPAPRRIRRRKASSRSKARA